MEKRYRFWSVYYVNPNRYDDEEFRGRYKFIPPSKKYIPKLYPKNALVKKHKQEELPAYFNWIKPEYLEIVLKQYTYNLLYEKV